MSIKTKSQVKVFQLDDNGKTGMKDIQKNILSATKKVSKKSKLKKIHYQMMKKSSCMVENYDTAYIKKTSPIPNP